MKFFFSYMKDHDDLWRRLYGSKWHSMKKQRTSSPSDDTSWKSFFAERHKVEKHWKKGEYSITTLQGHTGPVLCLSVDHDLIVSGSGHREIKVWDAKNAKCVYNLTGHNDCVYCVQHDGQKIVSGSADKSVQIWKMGRDRSELLSTSTGGTSSLSTSVPSGGEYVGCRVWEDEDEGGSDPPYNDNNNDNNNDDENFIDCEKKEKYVSVNQELNNNNNNSIEEDNSKSIISNNMKRKETGSTSTPLGTSTPLPSIKPSLATGNVGVHMRQRGGAGEQRRVYMRPGTITCTKRLLGHTDAVMCLQYDNEKIITGSADKMIKIWDFTMGKCISTLKGHTGRVWALQFEGTRLVSGANDKTLKIWDLRDTRACTMTLQRHTQSIRCLQFDSNKIMSGSNDRTIKLWDVNTGQCLHTLKGHTDWVRCLKFDDSKMVSGGFDETIKIWDMHNGKCFNTLKGHTDAVMCVQFDSRRIVSGSKDKTLIIWDFCKRNSKKKKKGGGGDQLLKSKRFVDLHQLHHTMEPSVWTGMWKGRAGYDSD
jgi:WD40 repeat protein